MGFAPLKKAGSVMPPVGGLMATLLIPRTHPSTMLIFSCGMSIAGTGFLLAGSATPMFIAGVGLIAVV